MFPACSRDMSRTVVPRVLSRGVVRVRSHGGSAELVPWYGLAGCRPARFEMRTRDHEIDRDLLRRYLAGDAEAFREIYRQHAGRIFAIARKAGLGAADADDVLQATFMRFHESRARVDVDRPVAPWLVSIAINLVRDRGRRVARSQRARAEVADQLAQSGGATPPDQVLEAARAAERMQTVLAQLPPAQREALLAVRVGGLSYDEAAEALGSSNAAVRQNVHRALMRLRAALADESRGGTADVTLDDVGRRRE